MKRWMSQDGDVRTNYHSSAHDGSFSLEKVQDVEGYLRNNKRMYNANQMSSALTKNKIMGRHKASIPIVIYEAWQKEFQKKNNMKFPPTETNYEWKKYLNYKLRDPDNRFFRVDGKKD